MNLKENQESPTDIFVDGHIPERMLQKIRRLKMPGRVVVSSQSAIKVTTVRGVLEYLFPAQELDVIGFMARSGVDEQPLGRTAIDGALNRHGDTIWQHAVNQGDTGIISIENGLFLLPGNQGADGDLNLGNGVLPFLSGANLATQFDPDAEYEDRAVAVVQLPGYPTVLQISPQSEAVLFPHDAVVATHGLPGGFRDHTVGSMLAERGLVRDKQDPHADLTKDREDGSFTRQQQMNRAIMRALEQLSQLVGA